MIEQERERDTRNEFFTEIFWCPENTYACTLDAVKESHASDKIKLELSGQEVFASVLDDLGCDLGTGTQIHSWLTNPAESFP